MFYIGLFIISFSITFYIKNYYIEYNILSEVNERSSHSLATPHGGGIAIAVTWFVGISYLFFTNDIDSSLYYALLVGIIISIVSYFDDLFEISAKLRLFTQAFVAILGLYFLGGFASLDLFALHVDNQLITNIFAFLLIIWFINLYNFLDGIDGYAGSEAVFLGISGFLLFGGSHFLVLVFATLGFLVWNWHKAKIFMGDVGSTLLGYNIAIFTLYYANQEPLNLWIWVVLFGLFWFDATLTLFRRKRNKEKLSLAHKKHAYQRLNQSGWSHDKVVIHSILVNLALFCLVCFLDNVFVVFVLTIALLYSVVRFVDSRNFF